MSRRSVFDRYDDVSRRDFIAQAALTFLGLGAMPLLGRAAAAGDDETTPLRPATARNVIYLFMSGGISQLDTFDPKPGAATQGPVEAIKTRADGVLVSQYFQNLAAHMDKVCVLSSLQSTQGAHAQGRYYMHTSYELRGTIAHPSLGAWLSRLGGPINQALPCHVAIGDGATRTATGGFLESAHHPLPIGDPEAGLQNSELPDRVSEETFGRRLERLAVMNRAFAEKHRVRAVRSYSDMYDQAVALMRSSDLSAFDITEEPDEIRDAYGRDAFGQGCLLARRLVEHDVRYIEVVSDGWDTHNENFEAMEEKCPVLDQTLAALLADLDARGLLEETLVVLATEFGRTPRIVSERNGRNHYPKAFTCLLAGGGVAGGQRYGKTDGTGEEIVENLVSIPDFNATIAYALGLPLDHVIHSPSGRPFTVADKGKAVTAIFA